MVQTLEGTAFQTTKYYDCLNYYTNGAKLKACQAGMQWGNLTRQRPTRVKNFFMRPKTKVMIPYSFFGIRIGAQPAGNQDQLVAATDTTNITHVYAHLNIRYNEWNQNFNFKRA